MSSARTQSPRTTLPRGILALAALLVGVCGVSGVPAAIHESGAPPTDVPYGLLLRVPAGGPGLPGATESTSTFAGFVRCPAESGACSNPLASIPMEDDTAYFRDVLVGAWTSISGAADGEVWSAVFFDPEGGSTDFPPLDFYANYGGYQNCFVTPWQIICGSTSIDILWFMQIQCKPTGDWRAQFTNTAIPVQTFTLLPQIKESALTLLRQTDYPTTAYDSICRTQGSANVVPCPDPLPGTMDTWKISQKGCALTSCAMVLKYHGVTVDPPSLNTYLILHDGYNEAGNIIWQVCADYGSFMTGRSFRFLGFGPEGDGTALSENICKYGPQVFRLTNRNHWVSPYGQDSGKVNQLVKDPDGGKLTQVPSFSHVRLFSGPEYPFFDEITGMRFDFYSPVELLLTDPAGRQMGFDPAKNAVVNEIPNSDYDQNSGIDDDETGEPDPTMDKSIEAYGGGDGDYTVEVLGTATGTYDWEVRAFDLGGNTRRERMDDIPILEGTVHSYRIHFEGADSSLTTRSGGFDGGGQRPRDVNILLTYGTVAGSQTKLPAGSVSYPLMIFYGAAVLPATFAAELNGVNVASLFHPAAGTFETVTLPVAPGRNVLLLSVNGQLPSRIVTDRDRLVFLVQ